MASSTTRSSTISATMPMWRQDNQPSYQVQQVIDGTSRCRGGLGADGRILQGRAECASGHPAGQFDGGRGAAGIRHDARGARGTARTSRRRSKGALDQRRDEIRQILADFGVPLVKCGDCFVSGDLPSHGPYAPPKPEVQSAAEIAKCARRAKMAALKKWLAEGANPDEELNDAIVADDVDRVSYLLDHGAHIGARDGKVSRPLITAVRFGFTDSWICSPTRASTRTRPIAAVDAPHACRVARRSRAGEAPGRPRRKINSRPTATG